MSLYFPFISIWSTDHSFYITVKSLNITLLQPIANSRPATSNVFSKTGPFFKCLSEFYQSLRQRLLSTCQQLNREKLAGCFFSKRKKNSTDLLNSNPLVVVNRPVDRKISVGDFVAQEEGTTSLRVVLRYNVVVFRNNFVLVFISHVFQTVNEFGLCCFRNQHSSTHQPRLII